MKLLVLLLAVGAVFGAQEFIDGEFFFGLEMEVDNAVFTADLAKYNLELVKFFEFSTTKIVWVKGDEADVIIASRQPGVSYWDRNMIFHTQQCSSGSAAGCWGLDRIDQVAALGYSTPANPAAVYDWGVNDGAGVRAYIIDSGIDETHSDFGGRAVWGMAAGTYPETDQNGHGTHCAGSTGSDSYGVAKSSTLVAVRVMSALGSGSTGDIVEGLNWVEADHGATDNGVGNMSLGGSGSNAAMNSAVAACIADGVSMAIAAGNSDNDACNYSPAMVTAGVTVCATDVTDTSASFTNWGSCVDICAPGVDILSTVPGEATDVYDGTSMAAPHVCGAIARYLSSNSGASPAQVSSWLASSATANAINFRAGQGTTPNLLLHVGGLC